MKHLVYNTSGLHEYYRLDRPDGKSWVTFNYFTVDDCIARALSQDSLLFAPGQRWDYCNINFMLLAKVVEKVSGQSFSQFAKERLFEPLGMNHTLINDDVTTIVKNRVTPYNIRSQEAIEAYKEVGIIIGTEGDFLQHPRNSPHYGGSGVMTTIEDLIKWCVNFYTHDFGGQTFYDIMHATPSFEHNRNNQAFGLYFGETSGKNFVAWDGGDYGISSQLMRFPEEGVAIICLSNLGTGYAAGKVYTIADLLIADGKL
ncbi:MAG: serine hydrolase domain-containing protein [Bacteroidota bacterium]